MSEYINKDDVIRKGSEFLGALVHNQFDVVDFVNVIESIPITKRKDNENE